MKIVIFALMALLIVGCGSDGSTGAPGAKGDSGLAGADGRDGADGTDGAAGTDGADGASGADGRDGEDGADGNVSTPSGPVIGYSGVGSASDPYRPFANGALPLHLNWTYYTLTNVTGTKCSYQIILPTTVSNFYLTYPNRNEVAYEFRENQLLFDSRRSIILDTYSLGGGSIELISSCLNEQR